MNADFQNDSFPSWRKLREYVVVRLLGADDPPHRLAMAVALGVFVAFTPTVGLQMVLVMFGAWLLKANKAVGLPVVWISNPATMVPIFGFCYFIGRSILGLDPIGQEWWAELKTPPDGWWNAMSFYWSHLMAIAGPLWLGSIVTATVLAVPTYYLIYIAIRSYRLRQWGALKRPAHLRKQVELSDAREAA